MTERTYKCNFCRNSIEPIIGESLTRRAGYGVEWFPSVTAGGKQPWHSEHLREKQMYSVENHICVVCLHALKELNVTT